MQGVQEAIMGAKAAALEELKSLKDSGDPEAAHSDADMALCAMLIILGHQDLVDAWQAVPKWYA